VTRRDAVEPAGSTVCRRVQSGGSDQSLGSALSLSRTGLAIDLRFVSGVSDVCCNRRPIKCLIRLVVEAASSHGRVLVDPFAARSASSVVTQPCTEPSCAHGSCHRETPTACCAPS